MTDTFALGKKENIDFNKLKSGITKKELGIENNTILSNIFDSIIRAKRINNFYK